MRTVGIARATCQWSLERAVYYIVVVLEHLSYAWLIIAVEMRMTIFNVRLSRDDEAELSAAAKRSGRSKSEIARDAISAHLRSEEHTSELQSLMRISYAVFCLKTKKNKLNNNV